MDTTHVCCIHMYDYIARSRTIITRSRLSRIEHQRNLQHHGNNWPQQYCTVSRGNITTGLTTSRDRPSNSAISLAVNIVISLLTGPSAWAPITSIMYHVGEGTRPCPLRGTETDGLPSPMATNLVVVIWAWSVKAMKGVIFRGFDGIRAHIPSVT